MHSDLQDIRHAQKEKPDVPERPSHLQLKLLVTGQPETGRTTTIRNLFASIAQDPAWHPKDVTGLSMADFQHDPGAFESVIAGVKDAFGHYDITYVIQVRLNAEYVDYRRTLAIGARATHKTQVRARRSWQPDAALLRISDHMPARDNVTARALRAAFLATLASSRPKLDPSQALCQIQTFVLSQRYVMHVSHCVVYCLGFGA
jgi:hypothetical protein